MCPTPASKLRCAERYPKNHLPRGPSLPLRPETNARELREAMNIHEQLLRILSEVGSPAGILRAAAAAIAEDQRSDACGVFRCAGSGGLVLWARSGEGVDGRFLEATATSAADAVAQVAPASAEGPTSSVLAVPIVSHARPVGALAVLRGAGHPYSAEETHRLTSAAAELAGIVSGSHLLEALAGGPAAERSAPPSSHGAGGERVMHGTAASPGIAIGTAVFRQTFPRELLRRDAPARGAAAERERLRDALQKTRNDLDRLEAATAVELGEEHALVFGAHRLLLADPMILDHVEKSIAAGIAAEIALDDAFDEMTRRLRLLPDLDLQERAEDVEDLRSRVLGHMLGSGEAAPESTHVVVSPRMTPSLVIEIKARGAQGIATEIGGVTSHGVLLARALGIPAVTGLVGILDGVLAGDQVILDGEEGLAVLRPLPPASADAVARRDAAERARTEFLRYRDRAPETADGVRFTLQANVALGADLQVARDNGAEGIGLYRTEFPFIVREAIPTLEEQVSIYAKAYDAFPAGPIAFRILDLAGDKLVPGSGLGAARSAFHGYRSLRVLFDYPHVLRDQVRAFALAARGRPLSILVPMVTSVEDLRRVKALTAAALAGHPATAGLPEPRFGAMIEVPGAVEITADLAQEAEFFSIGTNDLIQYALVIDREDSRLSTPHDAFHPAILRMVRRVVAAAHESGRKVSVCGEMAARPELAIALLALGVDALSITPRLIPELKQKLASVPLGPLVARIDRILALSTAADLEQALRAHVAGPAPRPSGHLHPGDG
jgi:phosphotransferase system enzyme I (PtsP)